MSRQYVILVVAVLSSGCGGILAKNGLPTCGQGGVTCPSSPKNASKATYHCTVDMGTNLIYGGIHTADLTVCLPANLNAQIADSTQLAAINSMSMADYDKAIFDYGEGEVLNHIVALMGFDGDGSKCDDLQAALTKPTTQCVEVLPAVDGTFCDDASNFTPINCCLQGGTCPPHNACSCVTPDPFNPKCTNSGINPNGCPCNTFPQPDPDECNITTGTVIFPTPGDDPPGTPSGILEHTLAQADSIAVDSTSSYVMTHVHIVDDFSVGHDDTETSTLSGIASLYGAPRADGTARLLFDMYLQGSDVKLHFTGVDLIFTVDVTATDIKINGGAGPTYIDIDSSGFGHIPKGALALNLEAIIDGQKVVVPQTNDDPIAVQVDFGAKTFTMPAFPLSPFANVDVTVAIAALSANVS